MSLSLGPPRAPAGTRAKEESAREMQAVTRAYAQKRNIKEPPYELLELIGKGSFGRVFKSKHTITQQIVAVKIVEIDAADFDAHPEDKDATIKDTMHEISVLTRLKESGARNVNPIIEAFEFNTQFWIVTEYCPGGSVHTLMKASLTPGLEEHFIIPIARELAKALKSIHAAGIVHRDIKCSNIFINENGQLQLGDFGIAGILENDFSKRSTVLGTPNWMPPEMVGKMFGPDQSEIHYGNEVDCWSYGCVIYEMATGFAPYARVHPLDLSKHLKEHPLRLEDSKYSAGLRDFVRFCLKENPQERPSASQILEHPYIADTEESHPGIILQGLIGRFFMWEQAGGQRASLFTPMGAKGPELLQQFDNEDDWNFSTTDEFQRRISVIQPLGGIAEADENSPLSVAPAHPSKPIGAREKRLQEARIRRGGQLQQIFNLNSVPYKFGPQSSSGPAGRGGPPSPTTVPQPASDLPLRNLSTSAAGDRTTMIDLDDVMSSSATVPSLADLDVTTIRANRTRGSQASNNPTEVVTSKRTTLQWKFPTTVPIEDAKGQETIVPSKRATMQWKFPQLPVVNEPTASGSGPTALKQDVQKRDTMAWTFADAMMDLNPDLPKEEKRDTMQFTFPVTGNAAGVITSKEHRDSVTYDALCSPVFGSLSVDEQKTAGLQQQFTSLSSLAAESGQAGSPRMSMIDLDQAFDSFMNGPATSSLSSSFTDLSIGDPFDLEVIDTRSVNLASDNRSVDPNMTVKGLQPTSHHYSVSQLSDSNISFSSPLVTGISTAYSGDDQYDHGNQSVISASSPKSHPQPHTANPSISRSMFDSGSSISNSSADIPPNFVSPVESLARVGSKSTLLYPFPHSHDDGSPESVDSDKLFQAYLPFPAPIHPSALLPLSDANLATSMFHKYGSQRPSQRYHRYPHRKVYSNSSSALQSNPPSYSSSSSVFSSQSRGVLDELASEFERLASSLADHCAVAASALERLESEDQEWRDRLRVTDGDVISTASSVSGRDVHITNGVLGMGPVSGPMPIPVSVSVAGPGGGGMGTTPTSTSPGIMMASSPPPFVSPASSGAPVSVSVSVAQAGLMHGSEMSLAAAL